MGLFPDFKIKQMTFRVAVDNALNDIQHKGKSFPVTGHLKDAHYSDAKADIVMARSINILATILMVRWCRIIYLIRCG